MSECQHVHVEKRYSVSRNDWKEVCDDCGEVLRYGSKMPPASPIRQATVCEHKNAKEEHIGHDEWEWRCPHCGGHNYFTRSDPAELHDKSPIERALDSQRKEIPAVAILRKAADLIEQRAVQRDRPDGEKSMLATIKAFNAIYGTELTEVQGWHFMELLKMVRSAYGVYVPDDFEDKVAYAALAAEAAAEGVKL